LYFAALFLSFGEQRLYKDAESQGTGDPWIGAADCNMARLMRIEYFYKMVSRGAA